MKFKLKSQIEKWINGNSTLLVLLILAILAISIQYLIFLLIAYLTVLTFSLTTNVYLLALLYWILYGIVSGLIGR